MNKKLIVQRAIQFALIIFLLFNIGLAVVTKDVSITSFVCACVLGVLQAVLILLLLYTDNQD